MMSLFTSYIRPVIEYSSTLWFLGYVGDLKKLEAVQRPWTKNIQGLEHLDYGNRLHTLGLFSVKGRLIRQDILKYWKILHGMSSLEPDAFFVRFPLTSTRGHHLRLAHVRTSLDIRRRFFSVRAIPLWNSLPESVVSITNINSFKAALACHLGETLYHYD